MNEQKLYIDHEHAHFFINNIVLVRYMRDINDWSTFEREPSDMHVRKW